MTANTFITIFKCFKTNRIFITSLCRIKMFILKYYMNITWSKIWKIVSRIYSYLNNLEKLFNNKFNIYRRSLVYIENNLGNLSMHFVNMKHPKIIINVKVSKLDILLMTKRFLFHVINSNENGTEFSSYKGNYCYKFYWQRTTQGQNR